MNSKLAPDTRRYPRGFALLEVLVAFAIAALSLAVLYQVASTGSGAAETAGYYQEALSRAKSHMAALGGDTPVAEGERQGDDGGPFHWRITITPAATAEPNPAAPPTADRLVLYSVEVAVSWKTGGRTREVALHSQRLGKQQAGSNG